MKQLTCSGCIDTSPIKLITGSGVSPGCSFITLKSTVLASIRAGVPVFRRPTGSFNSRKRSASLIEGWSPARPPFELSKPMWITPPKKVPEVSTTVLVRKIMPVEVTTAQALPFSTKMSSAPCWNKSKLGWFSRVWRMAALYKIRSAWARVARTAAPLRLFKTRNWMPALSVANAMAPPRASISRTKCDLPIPPIAGLQLIWPKVSILCVNNNVCAPIRAAARAASVPACPPPMTTTSYDLG